MIFWMLLWTLPQHGGLFTVWHTAAQSISIACYYPAATPSKQAKILPKRTCPLSLPCSDRGRLRQPARPAMENLT